MLDIPFNGLDYCRYGLTYRKELGCGIIFLLGPLDRYVIKTAMP